MEDRIEISWSLLLAFQLLFEWPRNSGPHGDDPKSVCAFEGHKTVDPTKLFGCGTLAIRYYCNATDAAVIVTIVVAVL